MKAYDVYVSAHGEEATSHGAEFIYDGMNPADALSRFVSDADALHEARAMHPDMSQLAAFDDEMSASAFFLDDGCIELHVYIEESDVAITMPPTEYMSASDAAIELGVSRMRINQLINAGKLDARSVGSFYIVTVASVESRKRLSS